MADATFAINFVFTAGTQGAADTLRDNALVDFCKARGLAIYQADGVTVDPTKVGPAIRNNVKAAFKQEVVTYRAGQAAAVARDAAVAAEAAALGNP